MKIKFYIKVPKSYDEKMIFDDLRYNYGNDYGDALLMLGKWDSEDRKIKVCLSREVAESNPWYGIPGDWKIAEIDLNINILKE